MIVVTGEVANSMSSGMVIDSGIENMVVDSVADDVVNPLSPVSVLGWLIGLPF